MSSIKDILSKTNQQIGLLDDDKKIDYAQEMSGFRGLRAAFLWKLWVKEFRTIIEGKRLITQQKSHKGHH